jgi:hypothetical protein
VNYVLSHLFPRVLPSHEDATIRLRRMRLERPFRLHVGKATGVAFVVLVWSCIFVLYVIVRHL